MNDRSDEHVSLLGKSSIDKGVKHAKPAVPLLVHESQTFEESIMNNIEEFNVSPSRDNLKISPSKSMQPFVNQFSKTPIVFKTFKENIPYERDKDTLGGTKKL